MGRSQPNYDYPEVRPPHPQTQYPVESQPSGRANSRFSWMEQQTDEDGSQRTRATSRQTSVPQLTILPEHVSTELQRQQQTARELTVPQQHLYAVQQPPFQQSHYPYPYLNQQIQYGQHGPHPQPYRPEIAIYPTPVTGGNLPDPVQSQHGRADSTTLPDPVKEIPDHPNYRSAIMPDSNPLSPTSPLRGNFTFRPQNTNMSVVAPTPSTYNLADYAPVPKAATGDSWSHSLCSCSEPSICMTALFCPCVLYGRTQYKLHQRSSRHDSTNMLGYNAVNGSCALWGFLCGFNGILSGIQKTRLRRSYEMSEGSGNVFSDCMEGCCCCCCVLARNAKEIKHREEEGKKIIDEQGYVPPGGMTFAPPPR